MYLPKFPSLLTIFEASLFVGSLVLIGFFPIAAAALCGLAIAVISFKEYGYQLEVLRGKNENSTIMVGYKQVLLCSMLFVSLLAFAFNPIFAPIIPFISAVWGISIAVSVLSALCAGGYDKLREDWGKSPIAPLKWIIKISDSVLSLIPLTIRNILSRGLAALHPILGEVFFKAQVAMFVIVGIFIQPALGLTALGYLGLSYLRTQNLLHPRVVFALERIDAWVAQVGGFFIPDPLMKLYSVYSIVSSAVLKLIIPLLYKYFPAALADEAKQKFTLVINKDISKADFDALLTNTPMPLKIKNDASRGLENDLSDLKKRNDNFYNNYSGVIKRNSRYDSFKQLLNAPASFAPKQASEYLSPKIKWYLTSGFANYVKYAILYVPMQIYWYSSTAWYTIKSTNDFLKENAAANPYAVDKRHFAAAPFILPPAPPVDFVEFMEIVTNSNLEENYSVMKFKCLESPQFQSQLQNVKADLKTFNDRLSDISKEKQKAKKDNNETEVAALDAERNAILKKIDLKNTLLVNATRKSLKLPVGTKEEDIFTKYILKQLAEVCAKIDTGAGLGWDKSGKSLEDVQTAGRHLIAHFKAIITNSLKIIPGLTEQLQNLKNEATAKKQIIEQELAQKTSELEALESAQDKNDINFDIETLQLDLNDMNSLLAKIETGACAFSTTFRDEESGTPVYKLCKEISIAKQQLQQAHDAVMALAVDAGDYCASGLSDVIFTFYDQYLANKFISEANLPLDQKFALHMQCYRKNVVNGIYNLAWQNKTVKSILFHMDPSDRHDRAYIMYALRKLHLEAHNISKSDSSNEGTDFLKEISATFFGVGIMELLMACENAYSPEGILHSGFLKSHETTCYKAVDTQTCINEWLNTFSDSEVKELIASTWMDGRVNAAWEHHPDYVRLQKILTLMLIDYKILNLNHESDKAAFESALPKNLKNELDNSETTLSLQPVVSPTVLLFRELPLDDSFELAINNLPNNAVVDSTEQVATSSTINCKI